MLVDLAERLLSELPAGTILSPQPARFTGGTRVGRASSDQAHLALGFAAPAELDSDYFAARLFADVVGGGTSSRLFQQLREERGLAYSVYSHVQPYSDTGILSIYAATARRQGSASAQLIEEILAEAAEPPLPARSSGCARNRRRGCSCRWRAPGDRPIMWPGSSPSTGAWSSRRR
jgi:predicted Zn-dependent peptidase